MAHRSVPQRKKRPGPLRLGENRLSPSQCGSDRLGGTPLALHSFPARLPLLCPTLLRRLRRLCRRRPAMEYEEESSDDNRQDYSQMLCENSQEDEKYEIPDSIEDEDYTGLELELMVFSQKHGKATKRFVAFEGTSTRRRFFACAEKGADNCGFV
ncbi:uncharacterized protein LOC123397126 [Hordeum vulgare subsp. vulgare]|uniref:uncharacterized protein LOC123397126 n=1 Tax=Hordeum vulgare subsp. vulgare TaxID=112509 RepID=UPI001D1A5343|nr:uncharacterized protein LOC123397126 [Hordeum vulgare subsp. vulgare]